MGQVRSYSNHFQVTLEWPYTIQDIRDKAAAFETLTEKKPVIRLSGTHVCTDGDLTFLQTTRVHAVGRKYITIMETHAGKQFPYQVDPGHPIEPDAMYEPDRYYVTFSLE